MELQVNHHEVVVCAFHLNINAKHQFTGRISSSQDDLDDESLQGKVIPFDNFSVFSSE